MYLYTIKYIIYPFEYKHKRTTNSDEQITEAWTLQECRGMPRNDAMQSKYTDSKWRVPRRINWVFIRGMGHDNLLKCK